MKGYNVAVIGATGAVGEALLDILEERQFPINEFFPIASERSAGQTLDFNKKSYYIENISCFDFSKTDIAFFTAGSDVSNKYVPIATGSGCVVIDNTAAFRLDPETPLIIPEVNPHKIADYDNKNRIANPNCSTIQLLVALNTLHQAAGLKKIIVSTYQSVSGKGRRAIHELSHQTIELLNGRNVKPELFSKQIAFNVIPHIDEFDDNGFTQEEMKIVSESHKILESNQIAINATCVRVPVFYGHAESVYIETEKKLTTETARKLLMKAPGVKLMDNPKKNSYPCPLNEGSGTDNVLVGRIREDLSHSNSLNLWIVADNIRKGAALNSVQIAEILVKNYL